jgi:exodeoxyribonuclease VII large subunit
MADETLSVRDLTRRIGGVLVNAFPEEVWVAGDIGDLRRSSAGHVYFNLVDHTGSPGSAASATLPVVLFDSNRRGVNAQLRGSGAVRMSDGVTVRIRGFVDFYAPQGRVQLRMTGIDPEYTLGRLAAERERLIRELRVDGMLEANGRLVWPRAPLTIGLVTSVGSAAHADFVSELERSHLAWRVVLADVRVQGERADAGIASAVSRLAQHTAVDVVAVIRGGGARTDLATFDSRIVAHAIAGCAVPVITGIGHEIDESIADLAAHRSFKTPTACAQALVDHVRTDLRATDEQWGRVWSAALDALFSAAAENRHRAHEIVAATRLTIDGERRQALSDGLRLGRAASGALLTADTAIGQVLGRVGPVARGHLRLAAGRIDLHAAEVHGLDPKRTLERGFSVTTLDGRIVRDADAVPDDAEIATTLAQGTLRSRVSGRTTEGGADGV